MIYTVVECDKCGMKFNLKDDGALVLSLQDTKGGLSFHLCPTHGRQLAKSLENYLGKAILNTTETIQMELPL